MAALVVAEHDNRVLKPATLNALAAAKEIAGADVDILVAGKDCRAVAEAAAQVAGRQARAARRRCRLRTRAGREFSAAAGRAGPGLHPSAGAGDDRGQEFDAAGRRPPRRDADFRYQRSRLARHLRAPDLCRQRAGDGAVERPDQGHHRARDRVSAGRGDRRIGADRDGCIDRVEPGFPNSCAPSCRNRSARS